MLLTTAVIYIGNVFWVIQNFSKMVRDFEFTGNFKHDFNLNKVVSTDVILAGEGKAVATSKLYHFIITVVRICLVSFLP